MSRACIALHPLLLELGELRAVVVDAHRVGGYRRGGVRAAAARSVAPQLAAAAADDAGAGRAARLQRRAPQTGHVAWRAGGRPSQSAGDQRRRASALIAPALGHDRRARRARLDRGLRLARRRGAVPRPSRRRRAGSPGGRLSARHRGRDHAGGALRRGCQQRAHATFLKTPTTRPSTRTSRERIGSMVSFSGCRRTWSASGRSA